jgi:WD40 repeat protein
VQATAGNTDTVVLNARAIAEASSEAGKRAGRKVPATIAAKVGVLTAGRVLEGHRDWILGLALSPDGKALISGDDAGQVIVWDPSAAKELRRWSVKGWVYALALSPDARQVLISERIPLVFDPGRRAAVKLRDSATGKVQQDLSATFKEYVSTAAFSPDGKVLALGRGGEAEGPTGKVSLVEPATGKKLRELAPAHECGVTDVLFHPDGKHLASSGRDTLVRLWQVADGKLVKELGKARGGQFKDWIHAIAISADGRWLAAADMAGHVHVWSFG